MQQLRAAEQVAIDADPLEPDVEILLVGETDAAVDLGRGTRDKNPHLGGMGFGMGDDQSRLIGQLVEDVGGVPGYENFLKVLADPNHERHQDMLEWAGGDFDAARFDIDAVNKMYQSLD